MEIYLSVFDSFKCKMIANKNNYPLNNRKNTFTCYSTDKIQIYIVTNGLFANLYFA